MPLGIFVNTIINKSNDLFPVVLLRGYRVTAQSIIPGILEREQEQSVVYGSIDFGKTVLTHPKYLELVSKRYEGCAGEICNVLPYV